MVIAAAGNLLLPIYYSGYLNPAKAVFIAYKRSLSVRH
ncbi:Uncharacterised protein [Vibrio cholerae]|nr:Uncharacterised protein [Vibrio cholerae]CSI70303.1 Uncharacterised protein [Vibrio cholerae]